MLCEDYIEYVIYETNSVLILVLMEDALRAISHWRLLSPPRRLNPCSNGRCSVRANKNMETTEQISVLILVLMEDALRVQNLFPN